MVSGSAGGGILMRNARQNTKLTAIFFNKLKDVAYVDILK